MNKIQYKIVATWPYSAIYDEYNTAKAEFERIKKCGLWAELYKIETTTLEYTQGTCLAYDENYLPHG